MHRDPLRAALEEHLDHTLADARCDATPDMPGGHRVVVVLDAYMAVGADLALDPLAPLPGVRRKRQESGALGGLEHRASGLAARHGRLVEPVEFAAYRGVHRVEREEGLVAQRQQDAGLDRADRRLHEPLVRRPSRACR